MNQRVEKSFDVFIIILTIAVLVMLIWESTHDISEQQSQLFTTIDTLICFIFLFEFFFKLRRAEYRSSKVR